MSVIDRLPEIQQGMYAQSLAEHLNPEYALVAAEAYQARRDPGGLLNSAWAHLELSMNQAVGHSHLVRDANFEVSRMLAGWAIRDETAHANTVVGAYVLSSYLPLFSKRASNAEITENDCRNVYDSLGSMISYLDPGQKTSVPVWVLSEAAVLALSARTGQPKYLLYPTSPREESCDAQKFNHDSYFYEQNEKYPIQQKLIDVDKRYDTSVTMLTLQPLIDKASRIADLPFCNTLDDKVDRLLSLLVCEANNLQMKVSEVKFLNFMSSAVVAHHASRQH